MIDISDVNKINTSSSEWCVIRRCFRDSNSKRADYLIPRAELGYPHLDYVRLRTLGLCIEEIKCNNIGGCVAEAGVFRGFFASALNELLPDRKLYLYDTFEGFDERDIEAEASPEEIRKTSWFSHINTMSSAVDLIAEITARMPCSKNVVFRKGYFPESALEDADKQFCFVSLDMDIYKPTLAALEFFWPRLVSGGYIFLHDGKFDGVQKAIREFRQSTSTPPPVPLCDPVETYVMAKP